LLVVLLFDELACAPPLGKAAARNAQTGGEDGFGGQVLGVGVSV
jgi:hypothetical protein